MFEKYVIDKQTLVSIANAVRERTKSDAKLTTEQIVQEILNMSTGEVGDIEKTVSTESGKFDFIHTNLVKAQIVELVPKIEINAQTIQIVGLNESISIE